MWLNADVATCVGKSGRRLTLLANTPGVQFYTGNFMDGTGVLSSGKGGAKCAPRPACPWPPGPRPP